MNWFSHMMGEWVHPTAAPKQKQGKHNTSGMTPIHTPEANQLYRELKRLNKQQVKLINNILLFKQKEYHINEEDVSNFTKKKDVNLEDSGLFRHFVRDFKSHCTKMDEWLSKLQKLREQILCKEEEMKQLENNAKSQAKVDGGGGEN